MKKHNPKFTTGSLFICNKCGKDFSNLNNAEDLKAKLRAELKNDKSDHLKIRVMVSGCLGVCEKGDQAFAYYPNQGPIEVYTASSKDVLDFDSIKGLAKLSEFIKSKLL